MTRAREEQARRQDHTKSDAELSDTEWHELAALLARCLKGDG
jgi:hypothetical protein